MANKPNIFFFHVDNLGIGELSCYSGGPFRGAWTEKIDEFAQNGFKMTNYAPEAQCTPTRSALLTGRYAIRSGTTSVPVGVADGWGLVAWEKTIADVLCEDGYACSMYGKWHVGEGPGRWPTDHGFQEWIGIPHTYDEALWETDPWYSPGRDPISKTVSIKQGDADVTEGDVLTMNVRRDIDLRYMDGAAAFIKGAVKEDKPFFVYFNHSLMHMPVIPRKEFEGKSKNGPWADCLMELDADFNVFLDLFRELNVADNTLVIFAGDNGPEDMLLWRGSPGFWEGSYFAGGEGNLRTPCIVQWPAHVQAGGASNEIMHVTDWFTTILNAAGAKIPSDRVIDGVNQLAWIAGEQEESAREGYPYWMGPELYGVKWHDFKLVLKDKKHLADAGTTLSSPHVENLIIDPHEREPFSHQYLHTWTAYHFNKILGDFVASTKREPPIPAGAPLEHVPKPK